MNNQPPKRQPLPPKTIEVLWFACDCLDIPEKAFEPKNFRQSVRRYISDRNVSHDKRCEISDLLEEKLFSNVRIGRCVDGLASSDLLVEAIWVLADQYTRICPELEQTGKDKTELLWLMCNYVFVPTIFALFLKYRPQSLGNEFRGNLSWYLPEIVDKRPVLPVSRILDRWLRVAGFKTVYGVVSGAGRSRRHQNDYERALDSADKKRIKRCLSGEHLPELQRLYQLVDKYANNVAWLDDSLSWKARLTLAYGIQKACHEIDDYFDCFSPRPSLDLADQVSNLTSHPILLDDDGVLADPDIYFAVLLLQRSLNPGRTLQAPQQPTMMVFDADSPLEEIKRVYEQVTHESNPGNLLLTELEEQAEKEGSSLADYIFDRGVKELRRLSEKESETGWPP